ncbi:MAG: efflux RND transporter permease subunit, partial [Planctomycetes bacterium]|nr:efflux RND transporter permease subunit [Planctomycetota bacterium]
MIERFARNPVYANLLTILIVGGGAIYLAGLRRETFPNFALDQIQVTVINPGDSPEDVEEGICVKIEEAIQGTQGVKKVRSVSREGLGTVLAELESGTEEDERDRILADIKNAVDRIEFPENAEKPVVTEIQVLGLVLEIAIHGKASERVLKELAEEMRKEILDLPEVSQVKIVGTREYRISIEVSEDDLKGFDLSLDQIVRTIRNQSLNLPGGRIETARGEITIRTAGQRRTAREFEELVLLSDAQGRQVTLGQVARVRDGFDEAARRSWYDPDPSDEDPGEPAVFLLVYNTSEEDVIEIAEAVQELLDSRRDSVPEGVEVEVFADLASIVEDRIDFLLVSGLQGMALVFLSLVILLGPRLAFWVSWGVPVSLLGLFAILFFLGDTINLPSTFAIVLILGMLVDDAIVTGENILVHYQRGKSPVQAAIDGAREVILPVSMASATTAVTFAPILFLAGDLGKVMGVIGTVVIAALAVSLVESFFCLPAHLAQWLPGTKKERKIVPAAVRRSAGGAIRAFAAAYERLQRLSLAWPLATIGLCAALFLAALGMIRGGIVKFTVFAEIDVDYLRAQFELPPGAPPEEVEEVARRIAEAAGEVDREHGRDLVRRVAVGQHGAYVGEGEAGDHLGEVIVRLRPTAERDFTSDDFTLAWREKIGRIPMVERVEFGLIELSPTGRPIEIRLAGKDIEELRLASAELRRELSTYPGVLDIADDFRPGKLEYQYSLRPGAHGFTVADLANQLRQGFLGEEVVTLQRDREEVEIVVVYPREERASVGDLDQLRVRNARGEEVPIEGVADRTLVRRPDRIHRLDGDRTITVSARIDKYQANAEEILGDIERRHLPGFLARHPGVRHEFGGQRGQSEESVDSLLRGLALATLVNFVLLAFTFRSYIQPLVIMSSIPPALFAVVVGHWLLGFDLSLVSLAGFVGLSGILINDSIVLVEAINDSLARGLPLREALLLSGKTRFRAIFLTSETTFVGLVPILMERSGQAKVMIPMAITVSFGILLETVLVLFLVPALLLVLNDFRRAMHWLRKGIWPSPEDVEPALARSRRQED